MSPLLSFQRKFNVPVWIGEFSAIRWAPNSEQYLSNLISYSINTLWGGHIIHSKVIKAGIQVAMWIFLQINAATKIRLDGNCSSGVFPGYIDLKLR